MFAKVWSYLECYQQLLAGSGATPTGDSAVDGAAGAGDDDAATELGQDDATEADTASVAGTATGGGGGKGRGAGGRSGGGVGAKGGGRQAKLLTAVGNFALPSQSYFEKICPQLCAQQQQHQHQQQQGDASLLLFPTSFEIDRHGRYAAVVWGRQLMALYDLSPLLPHRAHTGIHATGFARRGTSAATDAAAANVLQLGLVGAFPCRALPPVAGSQQPSAAVEYEFGSVAMHPHLQLAFLTVLRRKLVRSNTMAQDPSSGGFSGRREFQHPMAPLIYAVSTQILKPVLSCLGCYDVGRDISADQVRALPASLGASAGASTSINWEPLGVLCTPFTGTLTLTFAAVSVTQRGGSAGGVGGNTGGGAASTGIKSSCIAGAAGYNDHMFFQHSAAVAAAAMASSTEGAGDGDCSGQAVPSVLPDELLSAVRLNPKQQQAHPSTIVATYALSPEWSRAAGLELYLSPIVSRICLPPDGFFFGEGVLNCQARFAVAHGTSKQQQHQQHQHQCARGGAVASMDQFKLIEMAAPTSSAGAGIKGGRIKASASRSASASATTTPSSGSEAIEPEPSDLYPLLLSLRAHYQPGPTGRNILTIRAPALASFSFHFNDNLQPVTPTQCAVIYLLSSISPYVYDQIYNNQSTSSCNLSQQRNALLFTFSRVFPPMCMIKYV